MNRRSFLRSCAIGAAALPFARLAIPSDAPREPSDDDVITVVAVEWMDGKCTNVEMVEDVEGIKRYGYRERRVFGAGCTSQGQAIRMAKWMLFFHRNPSII